MPVTLNPGQFTLPGNASQPSGSAKPEKNPAGTEVLNQSLNNVLPGVVRSQERQSPAETARNILGFVQRGISDLRAQGADSQRLEQRLEAAREGIEKGYAEATEMLKGMGLLDDDMKEQIAAGRALVDEGLDALAGSFTKPAPLMLNSRSDSLQVANELSLQVLTRDGDRVNVRFSQSQTMSSLQNEGGLSLMADAQRSWSMDVSGSLSDAEQSALAGLFDDVQSLSERFFAGDLGAALEGAMNLGFDGSQLASMSLNLLQQTSVTSTKAYSQWQPQLPTPELESLKAPLASYVDSYIRALDRANPLADPAGTLQELVQKLLPEDSRMPAWTAFAEGLNRLIPGAVKPTGM